MGDDNSREERADQLHELIDHLTTEEEAAAGPLRPSESLREAVHRRMRQLKDSPPGEGPGGDTEGGDDTSG